MARVYKPRKKRIPLAASADRSQRDRDTFFGGKASALSGSKSTRGGRRVGRDRRSSAAVASASAPIVANRASSAPKAEPVEKIDDKIESTVSKLAEPSMEIPEYAKDVYEGLQDKPAEDSMEIPDYAKDVYEGLQDKPAEDSMEIQDYAKDVYEGLQDKPAEDSMKIPDYAKDVYEGLQDKPAEDSMEMPDYAKDVYEGAPDPAPPVANQSFKGMDSAGQTVLEPAPKSQGFLESMMERFPKAAEAMKAMAEKRALDEMLKKEMDRAEMSKRAADFLGYMEDKPVENPASRYEARGKIPLEKVAMPKLKKAKRKSFFGNLPDLRDLFKIPENERTPLYK